MQCLGCTAVSAWTSLGFMTNTTKILILMGHPDVESFAARAADVYQRQASALGAEVTRIDLAKLHFDLVLHDGYRHEQALEPDLLRTREALVAADHIVFTFPLWWTATPALVKGFIDRVFTPGFAFSYRDGRPIGLLRGRSARFITTMDAPSWWYQWLMRSALHTSFVVGTLQFVGLSPVRSTTFYSMREKSDDARAAALGEVERAAAADAKMLAKRRPRALPGFAPLPSSGQSTP